MEDQKQMSFSFEIDNFSDKKGLIRYPLFSSGGCEWYVEVYPKGDDIVDDHLSLYLQVANPESLRLGWKRRATYSLIILNRSGEELFKEYVFCAQFSGCGFPKALPLKKLQEKGFLEKNKLVVRVEVKVDEVVDEGDATENETFNYGGFQVLYSQVVSLSWIVEEHPDFAVNVTQKNQRMKTAYINILLDLIETLNKPPHSITQTELSNAQSELIDLTEAGFKLDWLETKLDEVFLERKKMNTADGSDLKDELNKEIGKSAAKVSSMENFKDELSDLKDELNKEKSKSATCAAKVSDIEKEVWVLRDEVSDLEDVLNMEKGKSNTCAAEVLSLKQTVSDLEEEVWVLKDEVSDLKDVLNKEKDKSDTYAAKVLSLEQTVLNQTVLNLRADLKEEKGVVSSWEVLDYADLHNEK
ncbi:unnamed protein product [Microthlaspi erraticum]|uniref:MATH domain-containing protein n=1 Tax=Microthlaspi erraticum TaxID=1685480 RepID=A0A6D2KGQ6_9BRAS|nr:unnamed protein product [Microthlaspi erraticum]